MGSTHPTHLAIVPPGDGDAVGGRGQVHEVSEVDGAAGPFGLHSGLIRRVVALGTGGGSATVDGLCPCPSLHAHHPNNRSGAALLTGTEQ